MRQSKKQTNIFGYQTVCKKQNVRRVHAEDDQAQLRHHLLHDEHQKHQQHRLLLRVHVGRQADSLHGQLHHHAGRKPQFCRWIGELFSVVFSTKLIRKTGI